MNGSEPTAYDGSISSIERTVDMYVLVALNHTVHRVPLWCIRVDEPSPARNDMALAQSHVGLRCVQELGNDRNDTRMNSHMVQRILGGCNFCPFRVLGVPGPLRRCA